LLRILLVRLGAVSAGANAARRLLRKILMLSAAELQPIWYGERKPAWSLRVLAHLFGLLSRLRRGAYRTGLLRSVRLPLPVIVVGNITVGGTGKTPLVIALVEALRARGFKPGVISRGYGGRSAAPLRVDARSNPDMVGDEPCLIFQDTHVPIAVSRDRVAAARTLIDSGEVDVLIADDGLQHYRLQRDVEICVIDGTRRFGNGLLLPAGPLREPVTRLESIELRVCNGGTAKSGEVPMQLAGDEAVALTSPQQRRPLREFAGQRVHAVAGIGNPDRFFAQLRGAGLDAIEHAFDDHHAYVASDLEFGDQLPVLMTAKDAVKCVSFARAHWWSVPVKALLPVELFDAVIGQVHAMG
jgi:tetraacyldisaccharide 4'-kinase